MKKLLILGAGTAGTMMANKLRKELKTKDWDITLVDKEKNHYYQPGFLFLPFGTYTEKDVIKPKKDLFQKGINLIEEGIEKIEADQNQVKLENGSVLFYDYLIVATGSRIAPEEVEGMMSDEWYKSIFDFYTFEGATNLAKKLKDWDGGKLVVHITEMPIKCPVAPLEFTFLADSFFTKKGMRDKVDITYVTPLSGAFTKPKASQILGDSLNSKNVNLVSDFNIQKVDSQNKQIVSWDETIVDYDLLVTIPTNMGDEVIERSGLGDELNFIPTDPETLRSKKHSNVFVIGDATNLPSSKAGSVAHFQADVLLKNFLAIIEGNEPEEKFDGHSNCFIETGFGKGILIDFNYTTEPLPGKYPVPGIGPFSLLKETKMNHMGKLGFRWAYWNLLLKGVELPIGHEMSMSGKNIGTPKSKLKMNLN